MKASQHKSGLAEKKPQTTAEPLLSAAASTTTSASKSKVGDGSPSAAVWSRYIDSRMKQFGTR